MMLSGYTCKASVNVRRKWRKIYGLLDMWKSEKVFSPLQASAAEGETEFHTHPAWFERNVKPVYGARLSRAFEMTTGKKSLRSTIYCSNFLCVSLHWELGKSCELLLLQSEQKKKVFWTHGKKLNWLIWQTSVRRTTEWDSIEVQHFPQRERENPYVWDLSFIIVWLGRINLPSLSLAASPRTLVASFQECWKDYAHVNYLKILSPKISYSLYDASSSSSSVSSQVLRDLCMLFKCVCWHCLLTQQSYFMYQVSHISHIFLFFLLLGLV